MDWTNEVIERLRSLWAEGHSTAEIGRRLGVSKNAIVGKAHRLMLPPRPSPIRRGMVAQAPKRVPPRALGPTLPSLDAPPAAVRAGPAKPKAAPAGDRASSFRAPPPMTESAASELRAVVRGSGRRVACCWPSGEPGTKSFRFCDAVSVAGKPYCAAHVSLAYVKIRDRREEAA